MLQNSRKDDAETGIDFADLLRWIERSDAGHVLLIVDACRSGYVPSGGKGDDQPILIDQDLLLKKQLLNSANRIVITSSKAEQMSWEDEELGHGVFTHFLLEALYGGSPESTDNNFIDLDEAFAHTNAMVQRHTGASKEMLLQEPSMREVKNYAHSGFPLAYRD